MTQKQQQEAFGDDLSALCSRYIEEFDLTFSSIIGVMELEKLCIFHREMRIRGEMEEEMGEGD